MRFLTKSLVFAGVLAFSFCRAGAREILPLEKPEESAPTVVCLADDALRMGLTELAEVLAREALSAGTDSGRAAMIVATAQMVHGKTDEAAKILADCGNSPQKSLRLAMLALETQNDWRGALRELESISTAELTKEDLPWFYLTRALAKAHGGDFKTMREDFSLALTLAVSPAQQTHFRYCQLRAELFYCRKFVDEKQLESLKEEVQRSRGTPENANFARLYIEALAVAGKFAEAREAFSMLDEIPNFDRVNFDLLEALVQDSPGTPEAQRAFMKVIRARPNRQTQEIAFMGLWLGVMIRAEAGEREAAEALAAEIENFLNGNAELPVPAGTTLSQDSRVADLELMTRLRIAVEVGQTEKAERLARELDETFPKSPFRKDALCYLVAAVYRRGDYLESARYFERLMTLAQDDEKRLSYQVALADCYAKVGDYARAAAAYGEACGNAGGDPALQALLTFQRVYAHIRNGDFAQAVMLVDLAGTENASPELNSWMMRAECVLISALRDAGRLDQALARCKTFLKKSGLLVDFRVRALWLQTLIAVELKTPDLVKKTSAELKEILKNIPEGASAVLASRRETVLEWTCLQEIRAMLIAGEEAEAFEKLAELRAAREDSIPATVSYIDEARYYAEKSRFVDALRAYENLIELSKKHEELRPYATVAWFESAQQNIALGREREAAGNYEQLVKNYPDSPLVFYARARQADLLRAQNEFDAALTLYNVLVKDYQDNEDILGVEIARADCLFAIAAESRVLGVSWGEQVEKADRAVSAYERLYSLPDADCALMAEAGTKWAHATLQKAALFAGTAEESDMTRLRQEAKKLYWTVADGVIRKASAGGQKDPTGTLGATGGYWVARALFDLAQEYEREENFDGARDVYGVIVSWSANGWIPGQEYARTRLSAIKGK